MFRALVGVGLLCGLLIVLAYQYTLPIIQANQLAAREAAVLDVLPGARTSRTFRLQEDGRFAAAPSDATEGHLVFAGYREDGSLVGVAIEGAGMGYQDTVRLLYGFDPAQQAIIGVKVMESRETPGLGTRVETDEAYLANFVALDVALDPSGAALAHPIEAVKPGTKTQPWQVDTITGATITSKAVADILREGSAWWMPRLHGRSGDFSGPGAAAGGE
jgi:electron transport complex protein RnfG